MAGTTPHLAGRMTHEGLEVMAMGPELFDHTADSMISAHGRSAVVHC